jgi:hypothetical protein
MQTIKINHLVPVGSSTAKILDRWGDTVLCEITSAYGDISHDVGKVLCSSELDAEILRLKDVGHADGLIPDGPKTKLSYEAVKDKYDQSVSDGMRQSINKQTATAATMERLTSKSDRILGYKAEKARLIEKLTGLVAGMSADKAATNKDVTKLATQINTIDVIMKYVKVY